MKPSRLFSLFSLSFSLLSSGTFIASMQSPTQAAGSNSTIFTTIVGGVAITSGIISTVLFVRGYRTNQPIERPPHTVFGMVKPAVAITTQPVTPPTLFAKIDELKIVPAAVAQLIAAYAAVEPKKTSRAPFYDFKGMRPAR